MPFVGMAICPHYHLIHSVARLIIEPQAGGEGVGGGGGMQMIARFWVQLVAYLATAEFGHSSKGQSH